MKEYKFKVGDYVVRTFNNFREIKLGESYIVEGIYEDNSNTSGYNMTVSGQEGCNPRFFELDKKAIVMDIINDL